nr:Eco57I restriction-modification methylase domain-containing protein [Bacteroidales bacterium]
VENTVGTLCSEKRKELDIVEIEFDGSYRKADGTLSVKGKGLFDQLTSYKDWLLTLKIVDPACGSGAFLNQALNFLIQEHGVIDDIIAELTNSPLRLFDTDKAILENNLYGVDINEESVEIAKLSLWLRTAHKDRKLSNLNGNIKCGNSLIDDPEVAGGKAFDWGEEFPEIMGSGGFDVVIGNPPYVRQELISELKPFLELNYETYNGVADLYVYFIELSLKKLLKDNGLYSIIVANKWMRSNYGNKLRCFLKNYDIIRIINFNDLPVFKNVAAYPLIITIKNKVTKNSFKAIELKELKFSDLFSYVKENEFTVTKENLNDDGWALVNSNASNLFNKIIQCGVPLKDYINSDIFYGVKTGFNEAFVINEETKTALIEQDISSAEIIKPFLAGRNINRYSTEFENKYLIFCHRGIEIDKYPAIKEHLSKYYDDLKPKSNASDKRGRAKGSYNWYELQSSVSYYEKFEGAKIIYPDISTCGKFFFDEKNNYYLTNTAYFFPSKDLFLLGYLNSKLFNFYFKSVSPSIRGGYFRFFSQYVEKIPIPKISENGKKPFIDKADLMLDLNRQLQEKKNKFINRIHSNFEIEKITKKLGSFYEFDFKTFVAELKKQKLILSLSQQDEWEDYFSGYKNLINNLQEDIAKTDKEIDEMVYELYGLSEEEMKIVEGRELVQGE